MAKNKEPPPRQLFNYQITGMYFIQPLASYSTIYSTYRMWIFTTLFFVFFWVNGSCQEVSQYPAEEEVAKAFKTMLSRPTVPFQPQFETISTDSVIMERGFIKVEENEKMPVLIYKPVIKGVKNFPVVICLHGTGGSKDGAEIVSLLKSFAQKGIMGVAIDARYHGERVKGGAHGAKEYVAASIKAWKNTDSAQQEHPFFYDTVFDLWRLTDYLETRQDVQKNRIGMMGISMGGIETWMAAAVDKRIKVAVPVIAAQSFAWSLQNDRWQGRAGTIMEAHQLAAEELGDSAVNKDNVKTVWAKLIPGITGAFDCPSMIRLFAPRPLLLLNTEKDMNCPLPGAQIAFTAATEAYRSHHALQKLKIDVEPNEPHRFVPRHQQMAIEWMCKWL